MKKNKDIPQNEFGFSLIEMVIYMAIFSLLLIVIMQLFTSTLNVQMESEATSSVEQDGRFILSSLMYDINRTDNIIIPASLGDETDTLEIEIDGASNIYSISAENLVVTNTNGSDNLNSYNTKVSDLTFKRIGNLGGKHTIQISFTISSRIGQNITYEEKSFQTTVGLR